ncbi:Trm112 family protein [Nesterenkonia natronophila]|nr:Trm112 family protein [Nesterenkonia natronophila]
MPRTSLIEPLIMQLLRCPVTGSPLRQEGQELVAVGDTNRRYPIDQGVPTLLKDHNS